MKNLKNWQTIQILLATAFAVLALSAQSKAQTPHSAPSSPNSAIRAADENLINACAATADELAKTRKFVTVLEAENKMLSERLDTETRSSTLLRELNETRKSEAETLRATVAAKNKSIAAKDAVIGKQDELVRELKNKKTSPWKRLGDVLIGVAIFAVLK